jgi:hypothetical protein
LLLFVCVGLGVLDEPVVGREVVEEDIDGGINTRNASLKRSLTNQAESCRKHMLTQQNKPRVYESGVCKYRILFHSSDLYILHYMYYILLHPFCFASLLTPVVSIQGT